ncbi:Putative Kinesin-domain-containing protein [Rhizopus microsporus]|nr:Putative Kinesin-domain-containing protein [Rhizopus microsporus]
MGIGLDTTNEGIVPRFVYTMFQQLDYKKTLLNSFSYQVTVSFLELHQEDLVDLLGDKGFHLTIREDTNGNICWSGVKEEPVLCPEELMGYLKKGSVSRTTAATDMNHNSSRSHAIFSINLRQLDQGKKLVSKFHFVDLAGSERLKRTNAVGDRAREGISINSGLLALGNVISALGDESRRVSHIPYRDSKLTRLLQDSLGGNSQTLMLACASPAESNVTETLNTLKYANRARNIRNRVVVNQEMGEVDKLKQTIARLKEELRSNDDFLHAVNNEMDTLKKEVEVLNTTLQQKSMELAHVKCERDRYRRACQQDGADSAEDEDNTLVSSSLVTEYAQIIESLKIELMQAQEKLKLCQERDDDTLVGSPCHSSNHCPTERITPCPTPEKPLTISEKPLTISDKTSSVYKKTHRVGSTRRSKYNKRKNNSISTVSPKQQRQKNKALQEVKRKLQREIEFLKQHGMWNDGEIESKRPKRRRRTLDTIQPMIRREHDEDNQTMLLQKLASMVEIQYDLIEQLENSIQLQEEITYQHHQKIAEMAAKRNIALGYHKRELSDVKAQYECRLKKQQVELQSLRRKHMQLMSKSDRMRHQNQSTIDQLNRTIEKINHEKKKTIKRMKQESVRAREQSLEHEKALSKLKKQEAQLVATKKRLEREIGVQKIACKRLTEEIVALLGQMKQITGILRKVMTCAPLAMTTKTLLAKALACANVRGYHHIKSNASTKKSTKTKAATLQQHVFNKKKLIVRAISAFVKGQMTNQLVADLLEKSESLEAEQRELLSERELVLIDSHKKDTFTNDELFEPQYMDERIDAITLQLNLIRQQLESIQDIKQTNADEEWTSEANHDQTKAYETALSVIRSLEYEEARLVSELLMEDMIQLQKDSYLNRILTQPALSMLQWLHDGLTQLRRATSIGELDPILVRTLKNSIRIEHGLLLPNPQRD